VTERGVCWLSFLSTDEDPHFELEKMKEHWHQSVFHHNEPVTNEYMQKIFSRKSTSDKVHLLVKGTNFQVKVWQALLQLPMGSVTTYQDIACRIHQPRALQAVGSAVGSNHIAYLIPCHRVIRKDGVLGQYRWDAVRKKSIIGWEMAAHDGRINSLP
jgi:AraC family transcriptional regulator, regulatory protein of adaptative response / methylated-DNA-[protein]-cysteine methyltransferase